MARASLSRRYYELDLTNRSVPERSRSGDSLSVRNAGEGDIAFEINTGGTTVYLTAAQVADLVHELSLPEDAPPLARVEWEDE